MVYWCGRAGARVSEGKEGARGPSPPSRAWGFLFPLVPAPVSYSVAVHCRSVAKLKPAC